MRVAWERSRARRKLGGRWREEGDDGDDDHDLHEREAVALKTSFALFETVPMVIVV